MGLKARPATARPTRYALINATPQAQRSIARLAADNRVDRRFVEIAAKLSWSYDPISRREVKGWVVCDDELVEQAGDDLVHAATVLGFPSGRTVERDEAVATILARLASRDPAALLRRFLAGAAGRDAAAVSELATFHYLHGATSENLGCLQWSGGLQLPDIVCLVFRKLFRAGTMDRGSLGYLYVDLAFELPETRPPGAARSWLPELAARIEALGPASKLTDLLHCTTGLVGGNKYFKQTVLEALAYAGVLRIDRFARGEVFFPALRDETSQHFYSNEWRFPLRFWVECGGRIDRDRLEALGSPVGQP